LVEIFNFENENEVFRDLDSLAVAETEVPVVVEDCVEVFDPNGVHWAVEHQPVVVQNVFQGFAQIVYDYAVVPVVGQQVYVTV
jgi:hypothetical protein